MGTRDGFAERIHRDSRYIPKELRDLKHRLEALLDSKKSQIEQLFTDDEIAVLQNISLECLKLGFRPEWSLGWYMNQEQSLGYGNSSYFHPDLTLAEPMLQEAQEELAALKAELAVLRNHLTEDQTKEGRQK